MTEASEAEMSLKIMKSPMLPYRSGSTASKTSSNSRRNSCRPKFVANTLTNTLNRPIGLNAKTVHPGSKNKKSHKLRCANCNKKINITNTFSCRCEKNFCPKHRHPEVHFCTYDYKTEGKKQLQEANPVISVPKLPKI